MAISTKTVKSFLKVDEVDYQGGFPFKCLLYHIPQYRNLHYGISPFQESSLLLSWLHTSTFLHPSHDNLAKHLPLPSLGSIFTLLNLLTIALGSLFFPKTLDVAMRLVH